MLYKCFAVKPRRLTGLKLKHVKTQLNVIKHFQKQKLCPYNKHFLIKKIKPKGKDKKQPLIAAVIEKPFKHKNQFYEKFVKTKI